MEKSAFLFNLIHRVTLGALLIVTAIIPLIINIDLVTAFVTLPLILVGLFMISIAIDQKIARLATVQNKSNKPSSCYINKCFHKSCFG